MGGEWRDGGVGVGKGEIGSGEGLERGRLGVEPVEIETGLKRSEGVSFPRPPGERGWRVIRRHLPPPPLPPPSSHGEFLLAQSGKNITSDWLVGLGDGIGRPPACSGSNRLFQSCAVMSTPSSRAEI